jgi:hypothetical protein
MVQQLGSNTFGTAKWIVSPTASNGTHTTIASALTSASSGDTIFIRPGTYTENLTLKAGVNLAAYECDAFSGQVTILGKCSFSSAGQVDMSGIRLQTNADYALEVSGSAASVIVLTQCQVVTTNNVAINFTSSSASASINLEYCQTVAATNTLYTSSSAGTINFLWCQISGNSGAASTMSAGTMQMYNCYSVQPLAFSGTASFIIFNSDIRSYANNTTCVANTSSGAASILLSYLQSGSATAVTTTTPLSISNCVISSSNAAAISGAAGTLSHGGLTFELTSAITVTNQTPLDVGPRVQLGDGVNGTGGCQVMSGTGDPNAAVTAPKGSLYLRTDGGGVNDRAYINTNAGTAWTAIVTVA